jgi:eukaryotic-like serine/threonine-protein kinase
MPYSADDATGIVMQHMAAPLPSVRQFNPDIPLVVEMVLSKALAKTREHRYQSADEFKAIMVRLLENIAGFKAPSESKKGGTTQIVIENPSAASNLTPALDKTTSPYDRVQDSRTHTLPFDEAVMASTSTAVVEEVEKPRRHRPLMAVLAVLLLAGFGGYAILNNSQTLAEDNPTPSQPAVVLPVSSETPTTEAPTATLTSTSTPTPTWTATITPTVTPSLDLPPVRDNFFSKPTAAPSATPTITPTVRPTNRPAPTQNPGQVSNPTAVPPTNAPANSGGDGGGGNNGGTGSTNPVEDVVDTVVDDVVAPVIEPVTDIVEDILPGLPCILNCP